MASLSLVELYIENGIEHGFAQVRVLCECLGPKQFKLVRPAICR